MMAVRDGVLLDRGEVPSDPLISHHHLRLYLRGSQVPAQDCRSTNGSYHYWHLGLWPRVRREMRMKEGALLRLGNSVLELRRRPYDLVVVAPVIRASSTA